MDEIKSNLVCKCGCEKFEIKQIGNVEVVNPFIPDKLNIFFPKRYARCVYCSAYYNTDGEEVAVDLL